MMTLAFMTVTMSSVVASTGVVDIERLLNANSD